MPEKRLRIEVPLTEAQKAFLDELGGNTAKHFRDAIRAIHPNFPPDPPFRVRKDYLKKKDEEE